MSWFFSVVDFSDFLHSQSCYQQRQFYFFLICIHFIYLFFIYFCLITLARTDGTMLKSSSRGHCCLVPDLNGKASSFSSLRMILVVGFSYMFFIKLTFPPVSSLLRVFNYDWILEFVKCLFYIY